MRSRERWGEEWMGEKRVGEKQKLDKGRMGVRTGLEPRWEERKGGDVTPGAALGISRCTGRM